MLRREKSLMFSSASRKLSIVFLQIVGLFTEQCSSVVESRFKEFDGYLSMSDKETYKIPLNAFLFLLSTLLQRQSFLTEAVRLVSFHTLSKQRANECLRRLKTGVMVANAPLLMSGRGTR